MSEQACVAPVTAKCRCGAGVCSTCAVKCANCDYAFCAHCVRVCPTCEQRVTCAACVSDLDFVHEMYVAPECLVCTAARVGN